MCIADIDHDITLMREMLKSAIERRNVAEAAIAYYVGIIQDYKQERYRIELQMKEH